MAHGCFIVGPGKRNKEVAVSVQNGKGEAVKSRHDKRKNTPAQEGHPSQGEKRRKTDRVQTKMRTGANDPDTKRSCNARDSPPRKKTEKRK